MAEEIDPGDGGRPLRALGDDPADPTPRQARRARRGLEDSQGEDAASPETEFPTSATSAPAAPRSWPSASDWPSSALTPPAPRTSAWSSRIPPLTEQEALDPEALRARRAERRRLAAEAEATRAPLLAPQPTTPRPTSVQIPSILDSLPPLPPISPRPRPTSSATPPPPPAEPETTPASDKAAPEPDPTAAPARGEAPSNRPSRVSVFLEALRESQASLAELAEQEAAEAEAARQRAREEAEAAAQAEAEAAAQQAQAEAARIEQEQLAARTRELEAKRAAEHAARTASPVLPQAPTVIGGTTQAPVDRPAGRTEQAARPLGTGAAPQPIAARVGNVGGDHDAYRRPGTPEVGRRSAGLGTWDSEIAARRSADSAPSPAEVGSSLSPGGHPERITDPDDYDFEPEDERASGFWKVYHWLIPPHVEGPLGPGRRIVRWLPLTATGLVLAIIAGAIYGYATQSAELAGAKASGTANPALVAEGDLLDVNTAAFMAPTQAWREDNTFTTVDDSTPSALCTAAAADLPLAGISQVRTLATQSTMTALHRIDAYDSTATAITAYEARAVQLGRCNNVPAYLVSGSVVTGLGDQAVGVTSVVQDEVATYHTELLIRSGAVVAVLDVSQGGAALPMSDVLKTAFALVNNSCQHTGGACAKDPQVTDAPPPDGGMSGWLSESDIPRITAGAGRWTTTNPTTTLKLLGSGCENINLNTVEGPTKREQRTYLLTEDSRAPLQFGVDEVIYEYATAEGAAGLAKTISDNIGTCASRLPTAKIKNVVAISGTGVNAEAITGSSRTVTLATSATASVNFRVAVTVIDKKVIYLLATPVAGFDFTDDQWRALAVRAAVRESQAS